MRRAFTLVELLVAIGLGLVICATAMAAVRACAGAATAVQRLSLENAMLREGIAAALDDLDWWTSYDDPEDPLRQPLRVPGEPFAALAEPVDCGFDVSAPRNWWRGLGCSLTRRDYGDYAITARIDHPDQDRSRLARFHRALVDGLGIYALLDHAPADTVHGYYGPDGRVPDEFLVSGPGAIGAFDAGHQPGDFCMVLDDHAFALTRDPWYLAHGVSRQRFDVWSAGDLGWSGVGNWQQSGLYQCDDELQALPVAPTHWPRLEVAVRHLASAYRQWHIATVTIASPVTGERQRLCFSTTSTTLRGARRQRAPGAGWAAPGGPTLDIGD